MDRLAPTGDSLTTLKDKILLTAFNLNLMYPKFIISLPRCQPLILTENLPQEKRTISSKLSMHAYHITCIALLYKKIKKGLTSRPQSVKLVIN